MIIDNFGMIYSCNNTGLNKIGKLVGDKKYIYISFMWLQCPESEAGWRKLC